MVDVKQDKLQIRGKLIPPSLQVSSVQLILCCRFDAIRLTNEFVEPTVGEKPSREVLVDRKPES